MELIDRYLHSVRQYLPERQQDDITKELAENLHSHKEEKEEALGRPLRDDEIAAMLKQFGHPMLMAGRYLPQKHLIGPAVFPYYWFTLKRVLGFAVFIYVLMACTMPFVRDIATASGDASVSEILRSPRFGDMISGTIRLMLLVFGVLTLLFAAIEQSNAPEKILARWDPLKLTAPAPASADSFGRPVSRPKALAELIIGVAFAICWLVFPHFPMLLVANSIVQPTENWQTLRIVALTLMLMYSGLAAIRLLNPQPARWYFVLTHVLNFVGVVALYLVTRSGDMVVPALSAVEGTHDAFVAGKVARIANAGLAYGALLGLCMVAINAVVSLGRALASRVRQRHTGGAAAGSF